MGAGYHLPRVKRWKISYFDEIFLEITEKEELEITRLNLSVVISRLRKKRGDIIQYKYGVFKLDKNSHAC